MTISSTTPDMTPGQARTLKARQAVKSKGDLRAARRLRAAGYMVIPRPNLREMLKAMAGVEGDWARGFRDGVMALADVSDRIREATGDDDAAK